MTNPKGRPRHPRDPDPQMLIRVPSTRLLDRQRRAEVVALLSRLLLQFATVLCDLEVDDDTP